MSYILCTVLRREIQNDEVTTSHRKLNFCRAYVIEWSRAPGIEQDDLGPRCLGSVSSNPGQGRTKNGCY